MQGLPFALVASVSPVLYKEFGFDNSEIAFYTSLFTLPWVCKFFFSPALEPFASKRNFTLITQFLMAGLILVLALTVYAAKSIYLSGSVFTLIALAGSIHDINSDGLYLVSLDLPAQAKMIGIRTLFYQSGKLLCQSGMIYLVGLFALSFASQTVWPLAFGVLAVCVFVLALYNYRYIPVDQVAAGESASGRNNLFSSYKTVFSELRQIPHLTAAIVFLLLYNLPESQLIKMLPLFMLDQIQQGGLGLNVADVGIVYGISVISMLIGVTLSGFWLNQFTLKKCLIPFTVAAALGNLGYLLLKIYSAHTMWQISLCVIIAQFFYGLSNGAYMLYLIRIFAQGRYAMSLYAVGTAIMLLGVMLAGGVCGFMQSLLGYTGFFIWIAIAGIGISCLAIYNVKKIICN